MSETTNNQLNVVEADLKKEVQSPINISMLISSCVGFGLLIFFTSNSIILAGALGLLIPAVAKYLYDNYFLIKTIKEILNKNQQEILDVHEAHQKENIDRVTKSLDRYDSLKYKKYSMDLLCAMCGNKNGVLIDLETQSFICDHCKNENAIFIQLATARKTQLLPDENLLPSE